MDVKIKRKNPKWLQQFQQRMDEETENEVAIGYPKGESNFATPWYENGASILDVAIWNNFGTRYTPRRPFMDLSSPKLQKMWTDILISTQQKLRSGEISNQTVLELAALRGESIIRAEIDSNIPPPNSPETIRRKKSDHTLIDTGDMRKYIKGVVRKRGS